MIILKLKRIIDTGILFGGWLHCFIFSYYEKHLLIQNTFKNNYQFIAPSLKYKQNLIQKILRVFNKNLYSNNWQNYLYSLILLKKKFKNKTVNIKNTILKK